jgi:hypothetical protein
MSTLWTPGGERPVPPASEEPGEAASSRPGGTPTREELEAELDEMRAQLARTPAAVVVTNHCLAFFELAALHLSLDPPQPAEAQLAIDALAAVVEGLAGRLGEEERHLKDALAQLRLAYVQIRAANLGAAPPPPST